MDGPRNYYTKWSKPDRERQISYCLYVEPKKEKYYKWTHIQNRSRPTDIENKLMATEGEGGSRAKLGVWDWHVHTPIYKIGKQGPTV